MDIKLLFADKNLKPKQKVAFLSDWILQHPNELNDVIGFAKASKDSVKASCIEALEFATKNSPGIITKHAFEYVILSTQEKAPRIKWESAKVIANTAFLFPKNLDVAINNLLRNTSDKGTVVRWSAATAIAEIIKLNLPINNSLLPAIKNIINQEEKNSIKKIYIAALKKIKAS